MENQHRHIKGYRELTEEEIKLMNEIKEFGLDAEALVNKVSAYVTRQRADAINQSQQEDQDESFLGGQELMRLDKATPERFAALGKTDLQTALMYLTRAVAQPTFF